MTTARSGAWYADLLNDNTKPVDPSGRRSDAAAQTVGQSRPTGAPLLSGLVRLLSHSHTRPVSQSGRSGVRWGDGSRVQGAALFGGPSAPVTG
jgi:hypothetical protein